jgi:hypothetical protein
VDKGAGVYLSQMARRSNRVGARTGAAESLFWVLLVHLPARRGAGRDGGCGGAGAMGRGGRVGMSGCLSSTAAAAATTTQKRGVDGESLLLQRSRAHQRDRLAVVAVVVPDRSRPP